jgi:repressor LexA
MVLDLRITYAYSSLMKQFGKSKTSSSAAGNGSSPLLTPKQKEVLDFLTAYGAEHGYAPSQQEIARHFGFKSLGTVQNYLVRLERQGLLRKTWNARRGMEVVRTAPTAAAVPLPLFGRVAAGSPIEATQDDETIDVPASMLSRGGEHFSLRVRGDSMIEDGILDGDYVIIRKQDTARNGETVVALVGNAATIKRYERRRDPDRGNVIELHPANAKYQPLVIDSLVESTEGFKIEGILVGVIRQLA